MSDKECLDSIFLGIGFRCNFMVVFETMCCFCGKSGGFKPLERKLNLTIKHWQSIRKDSLQFIIILARSLY